MGNCCDGESEQRTSERHNLTAGQNVSLNSMFDLTSNCYDLTLNCCDLHLIQYPTSNVTQQPVSREVLAEAAEKRAKEMEKRGVKGVVRLPKTQDSDLQQDRSGGGLRWQVD